MARVRDLLYGVFCAKYSSGDAWGAVTIHHVTRMPVCIPLNIKK